VSCGSAARGANYPPARRAAERQARSVSKVGVVLMFGGTLEMWREATLSVRSLDLLIQRATQTQAKPAPTDTKPSLQERPEGRDPESGPSAARALPGAPTGVACRGGRGSSW
jgi:hypothetical protein